MRHLSAALIGLCLLASPALSLGASWKQLSADMFIEANAITRSRDAVHANVKYLYDKDDGARLQKTFKSKVKPAHSVQRKNFYCNNRMVSTSSYTYYAEDGTVLAAGNIQTQQKTDVVPGSRIEVVYEYACQPR